MKKKILASAFVLFTALNQLSAFAAGVAVVEAVVAEAAAAGAAAAGAAAAGAAAAEVAAEQTDYTEGRRPAFAAR